MFFMFLVDTIKINQVKREEDDQMLEEEDQMFENQEEDDQMLDELESELELGDFLFFFMDF